MAKLTLTTILSGYYTLNQLNANFDAIEAAFEKCVFRDGTGPNAMDNDLDMGGYNIVNCGNITNANEVSASNTANLGGYPAADYPRKAEDAVITGNWTFTGSITYPTNVVLTNRESVMTAPISTTPVTLTPGATVTIDCDNGNYFKLAPNQNFTLANPTNPPAGAMTIQIQVTQDSTARTISWGTKWKWPGGTAGTLSTGSGDIDLITATYDPDLDIWMTAIYKDLS